MKIVFLDAATFGEVSLERFTRVWDCSVFQTTSSGELPGRLAERAVAVTNKVVLDADVLAHEAARDLRLIAVAATGTNNIDIQTARKRGVAVSNVAGYATASVAQHTFALILELAARAGRYFAEVKAGAWEQSPVFCLPPRGTVELFGKRLGVIGYGAIGRAVAEIARGFGMQVMVAARPGVREAPRGRVALEELLPAADVVTLHCPLTPETGNLLDAGAIRRMKRTAFLVNTARGGIVEEGALIEAVRSGRIAGAACDVLGTEPPPVDHPMLLAAREFDNLIITPHSAWSTREARQRLLGEVAENIAAFGRGERRSRVD